VDPPQHMWIEMNPITPEQDLDELWGDDIPG
jgi:hypothetical protein